MDFVNTLEERSFTLHGVAHQGREEFTSAAAGARWLRAHGLLATTARLGGAELGQLVALRDALRDVFAVRAGHDDAAAVPRLNSILAELPLAVQLDDDGNPCLVAEAGGVIGALGEVIARLAVDGKWHRLRMCAAPDCRWVFYDTSRNARGRWCSMTVCGNRDKTRRYRERHASA
jgi:predicted RNA-binding Zn ribbon-like protein